MLSTKERIRKTRERFKNVNPGTKSFWKGIALGFLLGLFIRIPANPRNALSLSSQVEMRDVDNKPKKPVIVNPTCNLTASSMVIGSADMMHHVVQAIMVSPHHPGTLVAILNVMHLDCVKRNKYLKARKPVAMISLDKDRPDWIPHKMLFGNLAQRFASWARGFHTSVEFEIPLEQYDKLIENERAYRELRFSKAKKKPKEALGPCLNQHISVWDVVTNQTYSIPLIVDPTILELEKQAEQDKVAGITQGGQNSIPNNLLGALVWINKSRRFYVGRAGDPGVNKGQMGAGVLSKEQGEKKGPAPRNDNYTMSYLMPWIAHHRKVGVQRIYVLDQDNDLSVENVKAIEELGYVTYIRAPYAHMDYYLNSCANGKVMSNRRHAVMQHIIDTIVLRMTPMEWLWVADLDEFAIPSGYDADLTKLVQDYTHKTCSGLKQKERLPKWAEWKNITCYTTGKTVYELRLYQTSIDKNDTMTLSSDKSDFWALTKCIFRSGEIRGSVVHFAYPRADEGGTKTKTSSFVLPSKGFMAHYRGGAPTEKMLTNVYSHAKDLAFMEKPRAQARRTKQIAPQRSPKTAGKKARRKQSPENPRRMLRLLAPSPVPNFTLALNSTTSWPTNVHSKYANYSEDLRTTHPQKEMDSRVESGRERTKGKRKNSITPS